MSLLSPYFDHGRKPPDGGGECFADCSFMVACGGVGLLHVIHDGASKACSYHSVHV